MSAGSTPPVTPENPETPVTPANPSNPDSPQTPAATTYTVSYTTEHGELPESLRNGITVNENTVLTAEQLPVLTDDSYIFGGWYDGTTQAVAGSYRVIGNVTLSATWSPRENPAIAQIQEMTGDGTVRVTGTISNETIRAINAALKTLQNDQHVTLDFFQATGLTQLEAASSSQTGNSFYGCTALSGIILPAGLTSIGDSAFYGCTGLTNVTIPCSVTSVARSAFNGCTSFMRLTIQSSGTVTSIADNGYAGDILSPNNWLKSVIIAEGITSIGVHAFDFCSDLTSVSLPSTLSSFGDSAFASCTQLNNLTIPSSVTSIGCYAFMGCSNLTSVTFEDTTSIWYATDSSDYTGGESIGAMSDAAANATVLTSTYRFEYLYKVTSN